MKRAGALAGFFLLLGGCAVQQSPAPAPTPSCEAFAGESYCVAAPLETKANPPSGEGVHTIDVSFVGASGARVPATLTIPRSEKPVPCVMLIHGLGGSRQDMSLLSLPLIGKGWATLAIDLPAHGERITPGDKSLPERSLPELHKIAASAVIDLRRSIDFLATRPEIDSKRLGVIGISLGAILGADFVALEPRVKAAALWSGGADWGIMLTKSEHDIAKQWRKNGMGDSAEIAKVMADVDPSILLPRAAPRPLLFMWGDTDTIVPTSCCQKLFDAAPLPKEKQIIPGGHVPDPLGMAAKSVVFLEKSL